jgi:hypothetical protein
LDFSPGRGLLSRSVIGGKAVSVSLERVDFPALFCGKPKAVTSHRTPRVRPARKAVSALLLLRLHKHSIFYRRILLYLGELNGRADVLTRRVRFDFVSEARPAERASGVRDQLCIKRIGILDGG